MRKDNKLQSEKTLIFFCNSLIMILGYSIMLSYRLSVDSYFNFFLTNGGIQNLNLGRVANYIVLTLLQKLNIHIVAHQHMLTLVLLLVMAWCVTTLLYRLREFLNIQKPMQILLADLSIVLAFVNVFVAELFHFSDMAIFWAGMFLFVVLALECFFSKNIWVKYLLTFINLSIALSFYQATIATYVIFGMTFLMLKHQLRFGKPLIKEIFEHLGIGVVAALLNIKTLDILIALGITKGSGRNPSFAISDIIDNAINVLQYQKTVLIDGYTLTIYWNIVILIVLALLLLVSLIKGKYHASTFLLIGCVFLMNYCVVFAPHFLAQTFWMAPRTIYSFHSVYTMLVLVILYVWHEQGWKGYQSLLLIVLAFFMLQTSTIQEMGANQIAVNRLDQQEALQIHKEILDYEERTGNTVEVVAFGYDHYKSYYFADVDHVVMDMNIRVASTGGAVKALNYYTGRNFESDTMPEDIYIQVFQEQDWDVLDLEEQLYFEGNKLYWIIY